MKNQRTSLFAKGRSCSWLVLSLALVAGRIALLDQGSLSNENLVGMGFEAIDRKLPDNISSIFDSIADRFQPLVNSKEIDSIDCQPHPSSDPNKVFRKCTAKISGKDHILEFRFSFMNDKTGEIFVSSTSGESQASNPVEFSLKMNVDVVLIDGKLNVTDASWASIMQSVQAQIAKIKAETTALPIQEVQTIILGVVKEKFELTAQSFTQSDSWCEGPACFARYSRKNIIVGKPKNLVEVLISISKDDPLHALIKIQVDSSDFTLKIPIVGDKAAEQVKKNFTNQLNDWSVEVKEAFGLVSMRRANQILLELIKGHEKNQCYSMEPLAVDLGVENYFVLNWNKKADNKTPTCNVAEDARISDKFTVIFLSYQFGDLKYGQLSLDSIRESSEYLIDLDDEKFEETLKEEVKEFMDGLVVQLNPGVTDELTIEKIIEELKAILGIPRCDPPVGNTTGCGYANKHGIDIVFDELTNSFKIKFFYSNYAMSLPKDQKLILTNQLVLQKYTSYDQISKLRKAVEDFKAYVTPARV